MKAIAIDDYGAAPTLHELPTPRPGDGEVRVRVAAASVNGFDLAVAGGYLKGMMEHRFPVVLGKDFAGTVDAVGGGVTAFQVGDPVFGVVTRAQLGDGAFGEYVAAPIAFVAKVPAGLELAAAGALGLAGAAASDAVDAIAPRAGETVLVAGATGGVGAFAVQLLHARGVRVIATAATSEEEAFVRGLGADEVVDRGGALPMVDAVLHLAGDGAALARACKPGGRIASTLGLSAERLERKDVVVKPILASPSTSTLDRLARAVVDGTLRVPLRRTYGLAEVPKAFGDFAAGTIGKLAIRVP